jgi:hypothetical protein
MDEKKKKTDALRQHLFGEMYTNVCAVLDGAAIPNLLKMIDEYQPLHVCLLRGVDGDPELAETAPYLVQLEAGTPFTEWVLMESVGKHWGIFSIAPETASFFIDLRKHFREMLRGNLPDGESVLFRYYDPRVCNTFLPTGDKTQLLDFFGPVAQYLAEAISEEKDSLEIIAYSLEMGVLHMKSI